MKLILILLCIFTLSSCKISNSVSESMYIASIGIEYKNDEFVGYFLLPDSLCVGKSKNDEKGKSSIAKVSGNTINEVFINLENSSTLKLNVSHISTLVIDSSMYSYLRDLIFYIKEARIIDYNFYVVASNDIEGIFKLENPTKESIILTPLLDPVVSRYLFLGAEPVHYLTFSKQVLSGMVVKIPYLSIMKIWDDKATSLDCSNACFIDNSFVVCEDKAIALLNNNEQNTFYYNDKLYELLNYHINISYSDCIYIDISYNYTKECVDDNALKNKIVDLIINNEADIINRGYYNSINKDIVIKINKKQLKS